MPDRARPRIARAIGVAAVVVVVAAVAVFIARRDDAPTGPVPDALRAATSANEDWPGWTETRLAVGKHCRRVLIADDVPERVQGLRAVSDLAPYDGMLFVQPSTATAAFTMSNVPDALDITWYDANGRPIDSTTMLPCPGTDATCPTYSSDEPFRYTLERPGGDAEEGALGSC